MLNRSATIAITVCLVASAAHAGTIAKTRYEYYLVTGKTLVDVYNSMLRRGPHVDGAKAYASTSATSSQEGKLVTGKSCRITDYKLKIDFVIRLPKIKDEVTLSSAERGRFQKFSQFLKKHEETHRSIWLDCAAKLETESRGHQGQELQRGRIAFREIVGGYAPQLQPAPSGLRFRRAKATAAASLPALCA